MVPARLRNLPKNLPSSPCWHGQERRAICRLTLVNSTVGNAPHQSRTLHHLCTINEFDLCNFYRAATSVIHSATKAFPEKLDGTESQYSKTCSESVLWGCAAVSDGEGTRASVPVR
jgi:hypothetical protein